MYGITIPVNARRATETVENERITIPVSTPFEYRLRELPSSVEGVKIRRITSAVKTGTGYGSMASGGYYAGIATRSYVIVIDGAGEIGEATFKWSNDGGQTWAGTQIPIPDEEPIDLELGVQVTFTGSESGQDFNLNDRWDFTAEYWTEVNSIPTSSKTFQVDYSTGLVTFYSGDAGAVVYATYEGRGGVVKAEDIEQIVSYLEDGRIVISGVNTSGLDVGTFVYASGVDTFGKADPSDDTKPAIGCVSVSDSDNGEVTLFGKVEGFSGLAAGKEYYLSANGGCSLTAPVSGIQQVVGRALSTSVMFINPMFKGNEPKAVVLRGLNTGSFNERDLVGIGANNTLVKASASWANLFPAVGFVRKVSATEGEVVLFGVMGGFSGLTAGTRYYLSTVDGEYTDTPPAGTGNIQQVVGRAISSTTMLVAVSQEYRTNT